MIVISGPLPPSGLKAEPGPQIFPFQKVAAKASCPPAWCPGVSTCLQPGIFLFFLLIQTVGFFCYVNFRWAYLWARLPILPSIALFSATVVQFERGGPEAPEGSCPLQMKRSKAG
jgi:hypothetical protein